MRIREVSLENFRSFSSINVQLPQVPILVIYDENGSGKTTVLEGIIFGLKGEIDTYDSIEYGSIDALFNLRERGNKRISAIINLEDDDSSIIVETNRPKRKKTYLTAAAKFDISFRVNGKPISLVEYKEICTEKLQIDYNTFPLANFLSQNVINDVLVSDAKVRGNVFSKILSTDWINSIIDFTSDNVKGVRKKKRDLEIKWQDLNATLQNTELDALYNQILENVKILNEAGIELKNTKEVSAFDMNSRLSNMGELLEVEEIAEYYSVQANLGKDLGKTRREKFVKRVLKGFSSLKVSMGVSQESLNNIEDTVTDLKKHIVSKETSLSKIHEFDTKIKKLDPIINESEKEKDKIENEVNHQKEQSAIIKSKIQEIKKIDKRIGEIEKKIGDKENAEREIKDFKSKISNKSSKAKKLDNLLPKLKQFKSECSENHRHISLNEDKLKNLDIDYPGESLEEDRQFIENETKIISKIIPEQLHPRKIVQFNEKVRDNRIQIEFLNNNIKEINAEYKKINHDQKINDLQNHINHLVKKKPEDQIVSIQEKLNDVTKSLNEIKQEIKIKEGQKIHLDNDIKNEEQVGDKKAINIVIIILSAVLSALGISLNQVLLIFILPFLIFLSLQFNLIPTLGSISFLRSFVPMQIRIKAKNEELSQTTQELEIAVIKEKEILERKEFYDDQIKMIAEISDYKIPEWLISSNVDPDKLLKAYKQVELVKVKLPSLKKSLHRESEIRKLDDKIITYSKENQNLLELIQKQINNEKFQDKSLISTLTFDTDLKDINTSIIDLEKLRDTLLVDKRVLKDKNKTIEGELKSNNEFEKEKKDLLILNEKKISYEDLIKLEKEIKLEISSKIKLQKEAIAKYKKTNKEKEVISKEINKLKGSIEGADLSIKRDLKELDIEEIPINIDVELSQLIEKKREDFGKSYEKLDNLSKLENEVGLLNDHLKKWDLIQSRWKKYQSVVDNTQNKLLKVENLAEKLNKTEESLNLIKKIISEENEIYLKTMEKDIIGDLNRFFETLGGHEEIDQVNFSFKVTRNKLNAQLSVGLNDNFGAPRALYSNGQQVSLVLALFMATTKVNNLNSSFKWIAFDEPTQFLDTSRKTNFIKTLKSFYNDLDHPQIIISTADKEFVDLLNEEKTELISILDMNELKNYVIQESEKPRFDLGEENIFDVEEDDAGILEDLTLDVTPEVHPGDISFGETKPTKAKPKGIGFVGISVICEFCKRQVQSATYSRICNEKDCIDKLKQRWFS